MLWRLAVVFLLGVIFALAPLQTFAQVTETQPADLQKIGVDEHLGDKLPLELTLTGEDSSTATLERSLLPSKPALMVLYYSDCPMLCSLVLTGLQKVIPEIPLKPGMDYNIIGVSIDPREGIDKLKAGRERFSAGFPAGTPATAWKFFRTDSAEIRRLTTALGFRYFWDEKIQQFAHPAVVFAITPDGRISRYLYGIEFKPQDVRMALLEAADGRIGNTIDKLILYCYHYDPASKSYAVAATRIMQLAGGFTVLLLVIFFIGLNRGNKRT